MLHAVGLANGFPKLLDGKVQKCEKQTMGHLFLKNLGKSHDFRNLPKTPTTWNLRMCQCALCKDVELVSFVYESRVNEEGIYSICIAIRTISSFLKMVLPSNRGHYITNPKQCPFFGGNPSKLP